MSTEIRAQEGHVANLPKLDGFSVGIVVAEWNPQVTEALLKGALDVFHAEGYTDDSILVEHVPGTVELTYGAACMIDNVNVEAVIVIGCVIRGGTPHFDYVCDSVTQGVAQLNANGEVPVVFGVLTTDNEEQALERAGGALGNKGAEAAEVAIKMADFTRRMRQE